MNTTERRKEILHILRQTDSPIAAKELAARFHVSRQVIVQDLAVIRASHTGIVSTYRGYILQQESGCMREFKVRHGLEQTADELNIIVDCGGRVQNVSISHRVYGRITAELDIRSHFSVRTARLTVLSEVPRIPAIAADVTSGFLAISAKALSSSFLRPFFTMSLQGREGN